MANIKKPNKNSDRELEMRNQLWPKLGKDELWRHSKNRGFTYVPRTMPFILQIMDDLSNGKPVSDTYFDIWCRDFHHHSFAVLSNPHISAFASGFRGQRSLTAWRERIKILKSLGFIDTRPGTSGEYHYVLILNPHFVIKKYFQKGSAKQHEIASYNALRDRALEVGISDFQ